MQQVEQELYPKILELEKLDERWRDFEVGAT
jgi:hypothetical protein